MTMSKTKAKYRIVPGLKEGKFCIQIRGWFFWRWPDIYRDHMELFGSFSTVDLAEKAILSVVRDELWQYAIPNTYYDYKGNRVNNSGFSEKYENNDSM